MDVLNISFLPRDDYRFIVLDFSVGSGIEAYGQIVSSFFDAYARKRNCFCGRVYAQGLPQEGYMEILTTARPDIIVVNEHHLKKSILLSDYSELCKREGRGPKAVIYISHSCPDERELDYLRKAFANLKEVGTKIAYLAFGRDQDRIVFPSIPSVDVYGSLPPASYCSLTEPISFHRRIPYPVVGRRYSPQVQHPEILKYIAETFGKLYITDRHGPSGDNIIPVGYLPFESVGYFIRNFQLAFTISYGQEAFGFSLYEPLFLEVPTIHILLRKNRNDRINYISPFLWELGEVIVLWNPEQIREYDLPKIAERATRKLFANRKKIAELKKIFDPENLFRRLEEIMMMIAPEIHLGRYEKKSEMWK